MLEKSASQIAWERRRYGGPKPTDTLFCRRCGVGFTPGYGDKRRMFCADACRRRFYRGGTSAERRASLKRTVKFRRLLLDRYAGRCGICSLPIDLTLPSPHPLSLTLDHIHPLSAGGRDVEDNLWPAHRRCNEDKGDEIGWLPPGPMQNSNRSSAALYPSRSDATEPGSDLLARGRS